jgi:hypothetical protein
VFPSFVLCHCRCFVVGYLCFCVLDGILPSFFADNSKLCKGQPSVVKVSASTMQVSTTALCFSFFLLFRSFFSASLFPLLFPSRFFFFFRSFLFWLAHAPRSNTLHDAHHRFSGRSIILFFFKTKNDFSQSTSTLTLCTPCVDSLPVFLFACTSRNFLLFSLQNPLFNNKKRLRCRGEELWRNAVAVGLRVRDALEHTGTRSVLSFAFAFLWFFLLLLLFFRFLVLSSFRLLGMPFFLPSFLLSFFYPLVHSPQHSTVQ